MARWRVPANCAGSAGPARRQRSVARGWSASTSPLAGRARRLNDASGVLARPGIVRARIHSTDQEPRETAGVTSQVTSEGRWYRGLRPVAMLSFLLGSIAAIVLAPF